MATIDLIVLGILKQEPLSAYDIQKLVEYRNISRSVSYTHLAAAPVLSPAPPCT